MHCSWNKCLPNMYSKVKSLIDSTPNQVVYLYLAWICFSFNEILYSNSQQEGWIGYMSEYVTFEIFSIMKHLLSMKVMILNLGFGIPNVSA